VTIGIVDVGICNLGSLQNALFSQGWDSEVVSSPCGFLHLPHLILPGVGAFAAVMDRLNTSGLSESIQSFAGSGKPVMGICLGMQLLADGSSEGVTEGGDTKGLGLIPGVVQLIDTSSGCSLPHVGWNEARHLKEHPILKGIRRDVDFYFVHSYRFNSINHDSILAETEYGEIFPSIVGKDNVIGVQFHPEKSQSNGLRMLDNFCLWNGVC